MLVLMIAVSGFAKGLPEAGRYLIQSWQTDQGLPQNSVISMSQARDGYLWLATFNGLVRFDGVRFTVFNAHNTPALDSSRIVRVWHDASGALWIGTESGGLIRESNGVFERIPFPQPETHQQLYAMCDGPSGGDVWFALVDGQLYRFHDGKIERKPNESGLEGRTCYAPFLDRENRLNVLTDIGIYRLRDGVFKLVAQRAGSPKTELVVKSRSGGWWRTMDDRIVHLDDEKTIVDLGGAEWLPAGASVLFEDSASNLWVGTYGAGVVRVGQDGKKQFFGEDNGLGHAQVRTIFEDHEKNIWIGTDGAGLHRLRPAVFSVIDKSAGLAAETTLAVIEDEDALWVATNGGGLTRVGTNDAKTYFTVGPPEFAYIWTLLKDGKTIWAGTWSAGVFRKRGEKFEPVPELNVIGNIVVASHRAPDGTLWFGGQGGLASWRDGKVTRYTKENGLSHDDVRAIIDDGEGGLWVATNGGGVNHFRDGKFTAIRSKDGLVDDLAWSVYLDSEKTLWVGTFGGGMSAIRGRQILNYTTDDGLPSNVICSMAEDGPGNLWVSSYAGVFRIARSELRNSRRGAGAKLDCIPFGKSDGLPSRECTGGFSPSLCVMRDGRMVFPTVKGAAIIDPENLRSNPLPPLVTVEEVEIDGVNQALVARGKKLVIPPGKDHIEFRYTGLSFSAPEKMRFRYKLEGFDTEWQEAGNRRSAYYSRIPPGEYEFKVLACNNDGVWSRAGGALSLRVVPAFWQTWWFFAGCVLMSGGAVAGAIRFIEIRKLHRRMELLEQQHALERERARIAKDIHDDLGASLTQITLLSELARTDLGHPNEAEAHIRQISGTARELTRAMDEIVWAINPQNDTLEDLLTYTVKFAQEHLKLAKIRCRVDAPAHLPPLHLSAEIRHNLFLAVKEAINNVAKHSHATEATLRLRATEKIFVFEIEDNGVGLPEAALQGRTQDLGTPGSHNGLRNMERRIRDIGGIFTAFNSPEGGAVIRMQIEVRPPELNPSAV